ncbi:MAG: AAA family ATPase, partial [Planctomycetota bacterium]
AEERIEPPPLAQFVEERVLGLAELDDEEKKASVRATWAELDELERRQRQLEIERTALQAEDGNASRTADIDAALADLSEESSALKARWTAEKELIRSIRASKVLVEDLRGEAERKERDGDFERVGQIRYGELPDLEKRIADATTELERVQSDGALLPEAVDDEMIAKVIARWTGIPADKLLETERQKLLQMEDGLKRRVVGQDDALEAISQAVRRARAGLAEESRPLGAFLLLGPTGVGKTETAKAVAEFLFDDERNMVRLDMSEFMEKHAVARLIGAPPGYVGYEEGGTLTEAVRRKPHSVILLDEVEKAHPDVFNVLLQLLDDGRLTDGQGRVVDFTQTLVLMTSNLRTDDAVAQFFRPEFVNRLDEVLHFKALDRDQIRAIVDVQLARIERQLAERDIALQLSDAAIERLVELGYDPEFGARPLKRALQKNVQNALADAILRGDIGPG